MKRTAVVLTLCVALSLANAVWSTPYASSISESAGTVSFILNEAADNVTINRTGEATLDLGTLAPGTHNFSLGTATAYEVVVSDNEPVGWAQTSSDTNNLLSFEFVGGLAVNQNPVSEAFGRVYVSNSLAATTAQGRSVGEGIYVLGADGSDLLGHGNTASTFGFPFVTGGDFFPDVESPFRLSIGPLDNLYMADWSAEYGSIYRSDADVSLASGELVLDGIGDAGNPAVHGAIASSVIVEGSLASGNLTVFALDVDLGPVRWS